MKKREKREMYEETLKRKPLRGFGTFLSILIVVFVILLLMLLVGWAQILLNIGYLQYILLAAVLFYLVFMLLRQLKKYFYVITEGKVLIFKGVYKKQKPAFAFLIKEIEQMGREKETRLPKGCKKCLFLFEYNDKDAYFIALSGSVAVLHPTEAFIQKLKEEYEKTHC